MSAVATDEAPDTAPVDESAPAPDAEAPEAPPVDPLESKLAALAQQGKGLQKELMKTKAQQQRDAAELAELKAEREAMAGMTAAEKIKHLGLDFGELTTDVLKGMDADDETPEQKQLRELIEDKQAREEREAKAAEEAQTTAQKQAKDAAVETLRGQMATRDDLPLASTVPDAADTVYEAFAAHAQEYGQFPDAGEQLEIALTVEKNYQQTVLSELKSIAERTKGTDFGEKVLAFFTKADEPPAPSDEQVEPSRKKAPRNTAASPGLNNSTGGSPGGRKPAGRTTKAERRARALERANST